MFVPLRLTYGAQFVPEPRAGVRQFRAQRLMALDPYVETLRRLGGTELGERAHGLFKVVAAVLAPVALEDA